jgi:protein-S-isoprenylcysteine O-methyltransferase Ste14
VPQRTGDLVGEIHAIALFIVMGATPLAILALGIRNYIRSTVNRTTIVLQALAALAVWIFLTFAVFMIFFMTVFEYPAYRSRADEIKSTVIFLVGTLVYFVVAGLLIYWTKRQTRRSQVTPP